MSCRLLPLFLSVVEIEFSKLSWYFREGINDERCLASEIMMNNGADGSSSF